jgi:hypothetical protein
MDDEPEEYETEEDASDCGTGGCVPSKFSDTDAIPRCAHCGKKCV